MQKLDFKFPLTVSTVHFICSTIGAYVAIKVLKVKPLIEVNPQDRLRRILPMSFVFCVNIVLGNVSLRYIPVSFMQTIKSFTPATTGTSTDFPINSCINTFKSFFCIFAYFCLYLLFYEPHINLGVKESVDFEESSVTLDE